MKATRKMPQTPVRMPDDLKQYLKHQAVDNHRSLNSEILQRLMRSRENDQSK